MAELDFSFDMQGIDRGALLASAAGELNALNATLGVGEQVTQPVPSADLISELQRDVAEFSAFPDVHKIVDGDFLARGRPAPVVFDQLAQGYNFYWLRFPVALFPRRGWGFNRLEVMVVFNPGATDGQSRPKAYQILPDKKFQTQLEISDHLEVKLDENFQFSASKGAQDVVAAAAKAPLSGSVGATVGAGLGFSAGPFVYRFKRAKIDHTPTGMEKVFWRLDGTEFFQEDAPELIVIMQAPKETKEVKIQAALQAYRSFSFATADLQEAVREFGRRLRSFFEAGAPLRYEASWDITPRL